MTQRGADPYPEPGDRMKAPASLALVQAFLNTNDAEAGRDALSTPDEGLRWFVERGLLAPSERLSAGDLRRVVGLREALRKLTLENAGGEPDPAAHETVNREAARAGLVVEFGDRGRLQFAPRSDGLEHALGRILGLVASAIADGEWPRLKACARDVCRWVFFDRSRNHSGVWCTMAICGSREKARAYYQRQASGKQDERPAPRDRG